jgi:hypothetical protein
LKHTKEIVIPIFNHIFHNFVALFAFDNSSNQSSFAPDALLALKIILSPRVKQSNMRERWNYPRIYCNQ